MKKFIAVILSSILMLTCIPTEGREFQIKPDTVVDVNYTARSFYINDQRISWSGMEATFGVECASSLWLTIDNSEVRAKVGGEIYYTQKFGDNILSTPRINKYKDTIQADEIEINQLYIELEKWDLIFRIGKVDTPFGRYYFPLYSNAGIDAPFIRTEAILWQETGIFLHYKPNIFVLDIGLVNGETDKDTNSSKGVMGRIGIEDTNWNAGVSAKFQDGISSGNHKMFNNHIGIDFMYRPIDSFTLSGEVIYDEYGMRYYIPENDINWPISLYYREVHHKDKVPVRAVGWYLNGGYKKEKIAIDLNYGEYYPENIGNSYNDETQRRGIVKASYEIVKDLQIFGVLILENTRPMEDWRKRRESGLVYMVGAQYKF